MQRGSDAFSEYPDFGEILVVEYLDDTGAWIALETFTGGGSPAQTFARSYAIPAAGRHAGFRLRFRHTGGSGPPYDFWHIDGVCFEQRPLPLLQMTKLVQTNSDPVNGTTNPKAIPGALLRYTIQVSNAGAGPYDYTPVPDGQGFDAGVTGLRISPTGSMNASSGGGNPSFRIEFSVRVK